MIGRRHWWRFGGVRYDVEVLFWKRVPKRNARISRFMSIKFYTINLENQKPYPILQGLKKSGVYVLLRYGTTDLVIPIKLCQTFGICNLPLRLSGTSGPSQGIIVEILIYSG